MSEADIFDIFEIHFIRYGDDLWRNPDIDETGMAELKAGGRLILEPWGMDTSTGLDVTVYVLCPAFTDSKSTSSDQEVSELSDVISEIVRECLTYEPTNNWSPGGQRFMDTAFGRKLATDILFPAHVTIN